MYYYVLEGGTYDEYNKSVFISPVKYTQEEFENIIIKTYSKFAQVILEDNKYYDCGYDLEPDKFFWNSFDDSAISFLKTEYNLFPLESCIEAKVYIGLGITPNNMTKRLYNSLDYSKKHDCRLTCRYTDKEDEKIKKYGCRYENRDNE